jgi:hypothetical protein
MNIMMSFVVINNHNVYRKAKRNCIKSWLIIHLLV